MKRKELPSLQRGEYVNNLSARKFSFTDLLGLLSGAAIFILSMGAAVSSLQPQQLPIAARLTVGQQAIDLEIARTPKQQAKGLKYRSMLASRGMLFPVHPLKSSKFA